MIPLTFATDGDDAIIQKVGGKTEVKKHLENMGFVTGCKLTVISQQHGNIIVKIRDTRVAVSKELANKIFV